MDDVTRKLARFIVESHWRDVPKNVRHEAKRSILNWLSTALGGCRDAGVDIAIDALREFSGPPQATVLGRRERFGHGGDPRADERELAQGREDVLHRTVVHVEHEPLQFLLGHGEEASSGDFRIGGDGGWQRRMGHGRSKYYPTSTLGATDGPPPLRESDGQGFLPNDPRD